MQIDIIQEHDFPQLSEEWFELRRGRITGSRFKELMVKGRAKGSVWGETALTLLKEKACEVLTGEIVPIPETYAMRWGNEHEAEAAETIELIAGIETRECGFFEIGNGAGSSPDRMIISGGTLEIKCPMSKTHFGYYLDKSQLIRDYKWQVNGELLATGEDYGLICSYDPRFPVSHRMVIEEIKRDQNEMDELQERINEGVKMIKEWTA